MGSTSEKQTVTTSETSAPSPTEKRMMITLTPDRLATFFEQDETPDRLQWFRGEVETRLHTPTSADVEYIRRLVADWRRDGGVVCGSDGYPDCHGIYQDPQTGQVLFLKPDPFVDDRAVEVSVWELAIFPSGFAIPRRLVEDD